MIGGVRFVGATLWSDWSLAGRWLADDTPDRPDDPVAYAAARMTDPVTGSREYRGSIRRADRQPWSPADAMEAHSREKAALSSSSTSNSASLRLTSGPRISRPSRRMSSTKMQSLSVCAMS